ncbi:MAG TPA: histidine kinase dimerization/phospho-acceptor domain-containing protein, partial [Tepidisphaeraceae bacterium]|nr:histidine kinase dimerization/phospho-acceptor domain-containing protein [Tepidisphaeraceae bacterium]
MTSLRRRFAIWFLSATAILAMAAGAFLYLYVQSAIYSEFDSGLHAKLQVIGSLLRIENNGSYSMDFSSQSMPEYLVHRHPEYFEVFLSNGKPLERSESLKGQDLITPTAVDAGSGAWDIRLPDGQAGRAMAGWIRPLPDAEDQNEPGWQHAVASAPAPPELVVVAKERAGIDRVLSELMSALIVAAVVLTIGSIFAVQFVVNQALKPVNLLAERAKNVGPQTLDYRFDIDAMPQELKPIAQRLNDLLMRLDQAFSRQRRLNADIAHELRTPIAELRSLSDIASRWPGDRAQSAVYFHDAHEIALKMGSLVET